MPNGKVHARISRRWRFTAPFLVIGAHYTWKDWAVTLSILPGWWLGALVDPDMDLPKKNTYAKQLWSRTIIFAWMVPWFNLYGRLAQRFLGGHRAFLTHFPVLSTSLRLLWLVTPFILILRIVSPGSVSLLLQHPLTWKIMLGLLLGMSLRDSIHAIADVIWR